MTGRFVTSSISILFATALLAAAGLAPQASGAAPRCTIHGTGGPDVLRGTAGSDVICGGGGADTLYGGTGDDLIYGGPGNDKLYGGPGRDVEDGGSGGNVCHGQLGDSDAVDCAVLGAAPRATRLAAGPTVVPAPIPSASGSIPPPYGPTCEELHSCAPAPIPQPPVDETAPELFSLALGPKFIDTSEGAGMVTLYLRAWDESGVRSGSIGIEGPGGARRTIDVPASEGQEGDYRLPIAVPASTPSGRYRLVSVSLEDDAGNAATLDRERLELDEHGEPTWFDLDFDVYVGPDITPPVLRSFSLSSGAVDTSGGAATVGYTIDASDDLSGVEVASPAFHLASAGPLSGGWVFGLGSSLAAGTIFEGTWEGQVRLPAHSRQGVYPVERIELRDRAGNFAIYDREQLEAMSLPVQFAQEGLGDTSGPEILDFEIEPRTISSSHGRPRLQVLMHVRDDLSGFGEWPDKSFSDLSYSFDEPGDPQQFDSTGRAAELVAGTDMDGEWLLETELPTDAPVGEYPITSVSATDRAGNQTLLQGDELEAEPWDLSFENLP